MKGMLDPVVTRTVMESAPRVRFRRADTGERLHHPAEGSADCLVTLSPPLVNDEIAVDDKHVWLVVARRWVYPGPGGIDWGGLSDEFAATGPVMICDVDERRVRW